MTLKSSGLSIESFTVKTQTGDTRRW